MKDLPYRSRTIVSKRTNGRGLQSRNDMQSISKVGESHHTSKPPRERERHDKHQQKRYRYERSPDHARRTHTKKIRSIEIGPFAKWIHGVALNPSLKISQFVFYSGQSCPIEHIYRYKSAMGLVTNDKVILCKVFPSTLSDKALTWFTSLKSGTIDSWHALETLFLGKFSTTGTIPKTNVFLLVC